MNTELLQNIIDIVFKGNLLYLSPILFLTMVVIFSEQIIDLIHRAFEGKPGRRR